MIFPALTVIAGSFVAILAGISLFTGIRAGGTVTNPSRFRASGVLLILHFPLIQFVEDLILPVYQKAGAAEGSATASYWTATAILVASSWSSFRRAVNCPPPILPTAWPAAAQAEVHANLVGGERR